MVALKIREMLRDRGYNAATMESSPTSAESVLASGGFDAIACVSPVYADFGIPKISALGMLTGMGEEQVINDLVKVLEEKYGK
jgi:PTS system galactitol-specific IIB component